MYLLNLHTIFLLFFPPENLFILSQTAYLLRSFLCRNKAAKRKPQTCWITEQALWRDYGLWAVRNQITHRWDCQEYGMAAGQALSVRRVETGWSESKIQSQTQFPWKYFIGGKKYRNTMILSRKCSLFPEMLDML